MAISRCVATRAASRPMPCVLVREGNVPACDPILYEGCVLYYVDQYLRNNEAANCDCPRQCHQLTYEYDISRSALSDNCLQYLANTMNLSAEQSRKNFAGLEVRVTDNNKRRVQKTLGL